MRRPPGPPGGFTRRGAAGEPKLDAEAYRLLRDLFIERLGVWFGPESRASLERRLRERLAVRGLTSFADYHKLLRLGPEAAAEWDEAAELVTTHETYFFREDYQLRAFETELLPMLAAAGRARRRLHVWSCGCSTGEETYTIAALILGTGLFEGWDVRVFGSDVSKRCIAAARRGVYGPASFRVTSESARARWFTPVPETTPPLLSVTSEVRALCHFGHLNLVDEERVNLVGRYDVIFCRNVLIYFEQAARRRVIQRLYEQLVPGGVLLLGHAESLLNVSTAFELLHLRDDLVYRRPLDSGDARGP